MNDILFYDASTRTYFISSHAIIHDHIRDVFYDVYLNDIELAYVDLIKDLQRRLGIPEITDEKLCEIYSTWNGKFLDVHFKRACLQKDTTVNIITYA